jgi:hypothetical protein
MKIMSLQSLFRIPEVHHFRPLSTSESPSRVMVAEMLLASELDTAGSVIAKHDRIAPSSSGISHSRCCPSVPNCASSSMLPVSGAEQFSASDAIAERPMISASGAYSVLVSPAPQVVPGRNRFHSLRARAAAFSSSMTAGWLCGSPEAASWLLYTSSAGYTWLSMKARSSCWSCADRAENPKSIRLLTRAPGGTVSHLSRT